jgi:hypothetical protein
MLHKHRETVKNELLRGKYWNLVASVSQKPTYFLYDKGASDQYHRVIINKRSHQNIKILNNPQLREFVFNNLVKQSLKGISGRSK